MTPGGSNQPVAKHGTLNKTLTPGSRWQNHKEGKRDSRPSGGKQRIESITTRCNVWMCLKSNLNKPTVKKKNKII